VCRLRRSSGDSVSNQLGGWSVSWRGVFGAGHVCCMGPPDQIPPATTVLKGSGRPTFDDHALPAVRLADATSTATTRA
jgi:hypothetical protein